MKAAREFATFVSTSREVQLDLAKHSWAPTMASIYSDPAFDHDPLMQLLGEVLPHAKARPSTPVWTAISAEIQQKVYPAYTGQVGSDEAVKSIHSFLERALASP